MKRESMFIWVMVAGFLFHNLAMPVMSIRLEDQKNYYSPEPHTGSPPGGSHGSPPHGRTPSHGTPTPSHGSGGSYGGTPPSHGTPTPSHGSYKPTPSPPENCGNPPHEPSTPSNPPSGDGGYNSPPYDSPPTTGGGSSPPIITPSPPSIIPGTPTIPTPPFDPNSSFPGTCTYWTTHPGLIWGLLGWWGTLGGSMGVPSLPGFGSNMSLLQALSNTRTDGFGALYREGTASWLNSIANNRFPFTTTQVQNSFVTALHSDRAAAAQAQLFKLANEGHLKPRT